jgi:Holliday junction resolvase
MPINSRTKGATFEREVAKILNDFFESEGIDYVCKRNLDQYQSKDLCDINIPHHAVECKFYKEGDWYQQGWWDQVCKSTGGRIPVLIFKYNRKPIRVCVPLYAINSGWEKDDNKVTVMPMKEWLEVLRKNWDLYLAKD